MVKRRRMHIRDAEGSVLAVCDARCREHVLRRLLLGEKSPARMRSQLAEYVSKDAAIPCTSRSYDTSYCNCARVSTHALASTEKEEFEYGTSE